MRRGLGASGVQGGQGNTLKKSASMEVDHGPGLRPTSSWNVPDGESEDGSVLGFLLFAKNGNGTEHQSPLKAWWQIPGRELIHPHDFRSPGDFAVGEESATSAYALGFACVPGVTECG